MKITKYERGAAEFRGAPENRSGDHPLVSAAVRAAVRAAAPVTEAVRAQAPAAPDVEPVTQTREEPTPAPVAPAPRAPAVDATRAAQDERSRVLEIQRMFANLDAARGAELVESGATLEQARKLALELHETPRQSFAQPSEGHASDTRAAIADALSARVLGVKHEDKDLGLRNHSVLELGRLHLESNGVSTRGLSKMVLAQTVLGRAQSTSDFPILLGDLGQRTLRAAYADNTGDWAPLVVSRTVPDFRPVKSVQFTSAGGLLEIPEGAPYQAVAFGEEAESYSVLKYGRRASFTWEAMINDDLGAFQRVLPQLVQMARRKEDEIVWAILTANAALADGENLFSAAHNNDVSGAVTVAGLTNGDIALELQTGPGGEKLNLKGAYLVVPTALKIAARKLMSSTVVPNTVAEENPYGGMFKTISSSHLHTDSTSEFYLFANPSEAPVIEVARLQGEESPVLETRQGYEVDGVDFKIRHTFGAKAVDFRGVVRFDGTD